MNWNNAMGYVRFIILPDNNHWQQILADSYNTENYNIKIKQNKKFCDTFDACIFKLLEAQAHHVFYKSENFGTILIDSPLIGLEKFLKEYSKQFDNEIIALRGHPECFDLYDIEIFKNGKLVRKSNYVGENLYHKASEILKPMYTAFLNQEIGEKTPYENLPYLLPYLAHFGWTEEILNQNNWQMISTNLD